MQEPSATPRKPIRILPPAVAERIAAGEVIERPSSVVKELVENALDAGATQVCVSLEAGGKGLIEVMDNGHGMDPESLLLSTKRHATSKLTGLDDLEHIRTLGFRGEALPSVAAVSDLNILSRTRESETAFELDLSFETAFEKKAPDPRPVTFGHFLGSAHGTRIQARGLFSQVPARLKFLKSQSAEVAQVREWLERLALAYPEVGFRVLSDGRTLLNLAPAALIERVRQVLSDSENYPIVTETGETGDAALKVRIDWIQGLSLPHSRRVIQVVNRRAIRDRMLQQALLSGFRQALLPGQFPAIALSLEIDPSQVDVNVHPTKTEIRFLDSRRVFKTIEAAVLAAIGRSGAPAYVPTASASPSSSWRAGETPAGNPIAGGWDFRATPLFGEGALTQSARAAGGAPQSMPESEQMPRPTAGYGTDLAPSQEPRFANPLSSARFVGVLFNTYIGFEQGDELVLVDQHAADERLRYEQLRKRIDSATTELSSQELLLPEAVAFPAEEFPILQSRLGWLEKLGFSAEIFGESSVLFRAIPAEWGSQGLRLRLKGLVERLLNVDTAGSSVQDPLHIDESIFEKLASEACHSAVRAGDRLEDLEARTLVNRLFEETAHPWNCPHGRPTVVRIPRGKLEEWFQRRV